VIYVSGSILLMTEEQWSIALFGMVSVIFLGFVVTIYAVG
jgi:hypothetical protein